MNEKRCCPHTDWQTGTDKLVQQSGNFEKQLQAYKLLPTACLLFESFISVASSTVFNSVKIEAIILPNAYLPALHAPSVHEGFYMMRWLTCSTHTIHYHMYTG